MTGTGQQQKQMTLIQDSTDKSSREAESDNNNQIRNCLDKSNTSTEVGNFSKAPLDDKQSAKFDSYTGEKFWQMRFEQLKSEYDHLQTINQNLEEKLLNIVDSFNKKREELLANVECEKSTLMADVNKLSTKLVDARIKLHDYEEKEILHAAECSSPCHRGSTAKYSGAEVPILSTIYQSSNKPDIRTNNMDAISEMARSTSAQNPLPNAHEQMIDDPNII